MSLALKAPGESCPMLYSPAGNLVPLPEYICIEQVDRDIGLRMAEAGLVSVGRSRNVPPLRLDGVLGTMAIGPASGMSLWDISFYSRFGRRLSMRPLVQTLDVLEENGYVVCVEPEAARDDKETPYRLGELGVEFALPVRQYIESRRSMIRRAAQSVVSSLRD